MSILDWPDVLRAVGIDVYERPAWKSNRPLGSLTGLTKIYWHHDASPVGNSPGAWEWICSGYDARNPSAQMWLSYQGQWRFVGSGIAYHAGTTANPNDWCQTVGLETDHTVRESYSDSVLNIIQRGFAAIAKHEGKDATFITFHKWEARPMGRKTDPYLRTDNGSPDDQSCWASELSQQRNIIQGYINGGSGNVTQSTQEDELSAAEVAIILDALKNRKEGSQSSYDEQRWTAANVVIPAINNLSAKVDQLDAKVDALGNVLFQPGYQVPGHSIREEVQWSATNQIIPAIEANNPDK